MGREEMSLHSSIGARGRTMYKLFVASNLAGIMGILYYRATNIPHEGPFLRLLVWAAMSLSELWFGLYWLLTQSARWDPIYRSTSKDRLSNRFEGELPGVDAFVCTADPWKEPPLLVIGTVLSLMAYDYPPEKLSVYLSDDGGSHLTLYALLEASAFSKHWLPFCRKFKIEPRSPASFFSTDPDPRLTSSQEWSTMKSLYEDMAIRIESAVSLGRVPPEIREEHQRLFSEWNSGTNSGDHPAILKILIGGGDSKAVDVDGCPMPTLVYLAREKRPGYPHHFKAGAMNALLRVSAEVSNAPIILNVDCDMYSNDSQSVRDALCFFMDEKTGSRTAFVQFPQRFDNITKNDMYDASLLLITEVEFYGLDRFEGPLYIGSGCFHRRESLTGREYSEDFKGDLNGRMWSKPGGMRAAFLGLAATTLNDVLVQQTRWSGGDFQILMSRYSPFLCGPKKISLGLQMCYCIYCLWVPNCFPTLCYAIAPSFCLLCGIPMFPKISSLWLIPFVYVCISSYGYSLVEILCVGGTFKMWWNAQRMWMMRRVTSYFFAFLDFILKLVGMGEMKFTITSKVADAESESRYRNEIMEFGTASPMFILPTTLAIHHLVCWVVMVFRVVVKGLGVLDDLFVQAALCGFLVLISLPIYEAAFLLGNGKTERETEREMGERREEIPLHSSRRGRGRGMYRLLAGINLAGMVAVLFYRVTNIPHESLSLRLLWAAMTLSELWPSGGIPSTGPPSRIDSRSGKFAFHLQINLTTIRRLHLSQTCAAKFEEELPGVDAFVCTADPWKEPPLLVIGTVLSLMAYDYPPEKLSVYLSDDGGSDLTLYALLEASFFSKHWLPFCRKFKIEPRSPAAFFSAGAVPPLTSLQELSTMKSLYEDMANRIESAVSLGRVPPEIREEHQRLFSDWNPTTNSRDHPAILKVDGKMAAGLNATNYFAAPLIILIGGGDSKAVDLDVDGWPLPTLLRVSSEISNAPIILNVDCDMYSNDSQSVRDALCFFMDERTGRQVAFVQFPQKFNVTKNDIYDASLLSYNEVNSYGFDGFEGMMYIGSACFHRRDSLTGRKYSDDFNGDLNGRTWKKSLESADVLEERGKFLTSCTSEENTMWGTEVGLKYGCPVEDVITGIAIQCRGWRSVYFNPKRAAFIGAAPATLNDTLIQRERWAEGNFQIFLSRYCTFVYGKGKISLGLQMCYSIYGLWAPSSLPALCYAIAPSLCLLNNVSLFPKISTLWSIPFVYVTISTYGYSLVELLFLGGTFKFWWNGQRMWMIRRATSYFFAFLDSMLKLIGMGEMKFTITSKVVDADATARYENEIMEFGIASPMFILLTTVSVHNLVCLAAIVFKVVVHGIEVLDPLFFQATVCGSIVLLSLPIYEAAFVRKDKGKIPTSVAFIARD
ncbi:Cellulose synthase-like protein E6 [Nymphaea thermarum]|nr:Cellulose synthase-like protein E6 [Nymphaea thermarum]